MLFLTDLMCSDCDYIFEALLYKQADEEDVLSNSENANICCSICGKSNLKIIVGSHTTKLNSREALQDELKRRSREHTLREAKKIAGHKGTLPPEFGTKGCGIA